MSIPRVGVLLVYRPKDTPIIQSPLIQSSPSRSITYSLPEYLCVYQDASRLWGFPKGRWKTFESYTQGACRELLEETGIKIYHNDLSFDNMYHIKRGKHHHYYFIKEVSHKPVVTVDGVEIIGYKWMTIPELSNRNVSYFTDQVIKRMNEPSTPYASDEDILVKDIENMNLYPLIIRPNLLMTLA